MLLKLRERMESEKGFTLVELLVVILIIGILAAIAIPSFLSQTDKAADAQAKSAARNAQTAAETYNVDNNGSYTGMDATDLQTIEPQLANANIGGTLTATPNAGGDGYSVEVSNTKSGNSFLVTRAAAGTVTRTCGLGAGGAGAGGTGGCPAGKTW
jgi:type IV pilus assembly protein PilA